MSHAADVRAIKAFVDDGDANSEYIGWEEENEPDDSADKLEMNINGIKHFTFDVASRKLSSDQQELRQFVQLMNEFLSKTPPPSMKDAMKEATRLCVQYNLSSDMDEDAGDDAVFIPQSGTRKSNEQYQEEQELESIVESFEKSVNGSNKQAASRIIADYKGIYKTHGKYGFSAEPRKENLFVWDVRVGGFDKGSTLFRDLQQYQKKSGKDYVEMQMDFPVDYPFSPPFIRVVRPRFKFHTGHVTIGGSICMELLTRKGWTAANSIESVLISIHAELSSGNGEIDFSNPADYSDHEAKAAFQRVAQQHGWDK